MLHVIMFWIKQMGWFIGRTPILYTHKHNHRGKWNVYSNMTERETIGNSRGRNAQSNQNILLLFFLEIYCRNEWMEMERVSQTRTYIIYSTLKSSCVGKSVVGFFFFHLWATIPMLNVYRFRAYNSIPTIAFKKFSFTNIADVDRYLDVGAYTIRTHKSRAFWNCISISAQIVWSGTYTVHTIGIPMSSPQNNDMVQSVSSA